jgi:hypothetical protein
MRFVWKYTAGVWWVQALCWVRLLFKCDVEGGCAGWEQALHVRARGGGRCEIKDVRV